MTRPQFVKLCAELQRAVMFASSETRGGAVGQVLLMGSIARWPGADALLRSLVELPVTVPQPLACVPGLVGSDTGQRRPELVVAAGLALRGFLSHA